MPETTVRTDLLQPLEVVTRLRVDGVGENLRVLAIDNVSLPVQEPCRDLELGRILEDGNDTLELIRVELTSPESGMRTWSQDRHLITHRLLRSTSAFLHAMLE